MAYFRKHGNGWQASIERRGVRRAQTFLSKAAAVAWAGRQEAEIMGGVRGEIPNLTVRELLERYEREVSAGKKGQRWEAIRLGRVGASTLGAVRLRQLDTPHVSAWQQERLKAVSGASVRRERNLLNNVFNIAVNEWRWLTKNPFKGVRRPKDGKPRTRIATPAELARLERHASPAMKRVIIWAVETGMRAGEIAALRDVKGRVASLHDSKTGEGRDVPLSAKALEQWQEGGFGLKASSISAKFAQYCGDLEIEGLTFHDLRATAATRLSKKIDALQLAKMLGHKNPKMLMVYYRETAADVAKLL